MLTHSDDHKPLPSNPNEAQWVIQRLIDFILEEALWAILAMVKIVCIVISDVLPNIG